MQQEKINPKRLTKLYLDGIIQNKPQEVNSKGGYKMKTKLGEYLRTLRLSNQQILKDMADILGVTSSFLSAVENGKKKMPETWYSVFQREYSLMDDEIDDLKQLAMESQNSIALDLRNSSSASKQLAVSFARQFNDMDEETSMQILSFLKELKKEDPKK